MYNFVFFLYHFYTYIINLLFIIFQDSQLIKQILYFVDICVRLRLLKTLQIFIFDSMVFLPNKYCCIIFISLLLWKNCLPRSINNEEGEYVVITFISNKT